MSASREHSSWARICAPHPSPRSTSALRTCAAPIWPVPRCPAPICAERGWTGPTCRRRAGRTWCVRTAPNRSGASPVTGICLPAAPEPGSRATESAKNHRSGRHTVAEPPTGATSQEPAPPRRSGPSGNPDAGALPRRGVLHGIAAAATAGAVGTLVGGCADQRRAPALSARTPRPPTATGGQASTSRAPAAIPPGLPYEIVHGPRERPLVALTFHGQGDPALATALLKEAERAGARVTVLAVGSWLDEQPRMARRILDGGHELGNHTLRHI